MEARLSTLGTSDPLSPEEPEEPEDRPEPRSTNLEKNAGLFSRATFHWVDPLVKSGAKSPLGANELLELPPEQDTGPWAERFQREWKALSGLQPRLPMTLVFSRMFRPTLVLALAISLVSTCLILSVPVIIHLFLTEFASSGSSKGVLLAMAALLICFPPLANILMHHVFHITLKMGMNIRSALVTAIYRKSLRLSHKSRARTTSGEIVNLMSVDAANIYQMASIVYQFVTSPLQLLVGSALLYKALGPAALFGVLAMSCMIPVSIYLTKKGSQKRRSLVEKADARVSLMSEILQGIRAIKFYSWEKSFLGKILQMKDNERKDLKSIAQIGSMSTLVFTTAPFLAAATSFSAFVLMGKSLSSPIVFSSLAVFGILRNSLGQLPHLFSSLINGNIAANRFRHFLALPELETRDDSSFANIYEKETKKNSENGHILFQNVSAKWANRPVLQDLNLKIQPGELVAIVGPIGSGKSSLIQLILSELQPESGQIFAKGSIAYASQNPWIRNASVRENILFFRKMDEKKYQEVLASCELTQDLDSLESSDLTEIGERGVNLSGGQKQRVSLARTIYGDADIFLFDETFSALDHHVGLRVFEQCLLKQLAEKTRVLVTHRFEFLPRVDRIVVMNEGKIVESGSLAELLAKGGEFASLWENSSFASSQTRTSVAESPPSKASPSMANPSVAESSMASQTLSSPPRSLHQLKASAPESRIVLDEERNTGSVKSDLYSMYAKLASPAGMVSLLLIAYFLRELFSSGADVWIGLWSSSTTHGDANKMIVVYLLLGVIATAVTYFRTLLTWQGALRASNTLHRRLLENVLRAPLSFFDSTPVGRVLNRFGKDIESVDQYLPNTLMETLACFFTIFSTLIVIGSANPFAILLFGPVIFIYIKIQSLFRKSSREAKRLENISRSPLFAHFSESLNGATVIRAFGSQTPFYREAVRRYEGNQMAFYTIISLNRWLGIRLESLGALVIASCSGFALLFPQHINPGLLGLSLTASFLVTGVLNWAVRMASEVESSMNSVERIHHYTQLDSEKWEGKDPEPNWPQRGKVEFRNVELRYRSFGRPILDNISFVAPAGAFVGIVGRTGAGKSSLLAALFRLTEISSGDILIDDKSILDLRLDKLREQIVIVPQDPVLFAGTLRKNLDPFQVVAEVTLNDVLERVGLTRELGFHLDFIVQENGANFSVGQRQLICLARALLKDVPIVVMDEATSNIDPETDAKIGKIIHEEFRDRTILVIAHRLSTVETADSILFLDKGQVEGFGPPSEVLPSLKIWIHAFPAEQPKG